MYLYCSDCDVKVTIMWIKFEEKKKEYVKQEKYITDFNFSTSPDFKFSTSPDFKFSTSPDFKFSTSPAYKTTHQGERMSEVFVPGML